MSSDVKMIVFIVAIVFAYFLSGMFLLQSFEQTPMVGGILSVVLSLIVFWITGVFGPRVANKLNVVW